MSYEMKVKAKDVCEKILYITLPLPSRIKKYNLPEGTCVINLINRIKMFEKNVKNYFFGTKLDNISFKQIEEQSDFIKEDNYVTFTFDNEEDLFYFQLKSNAEIFEVKEIK